MLKHQWIMEPANDHFGHPFSWPCHEWIAGVMERGLSWSGCAEYAEPTRLTAADIRAAMAWYRATGWLLEPADKHFIGGRTDETARDFIDRGRRDHGWLWRWVASKLRPASARSATALRAACKRLDDELRRDREKQLGWHQQEADAT